MKNASHGLTAFLVMLVVVAVVLGTAFGIGYFVCKLLV